jgi:hypothetical protein
LRNTQTSKKRGTYQQPRTSFSGYLHYLPDIRRFQFFSEQIQAKLQVGFDFFSEKKHFVSWKDDKYAASVGRPNSSEESMVLVCLDSSARLR